MTRIEQDLDAKTTLLVETGDSWLNGMLTRLPDGPVSRSRCNTARSAGRSPPASASRSAWSLTGVCLSVIGDRSFQLTAQEVSNMIRRSQETLIFLVNNHGYVIDRDP